MEPSPPLLSALFPSSFSLHSPPSLSPVSHRPSHSRGRQEADRGGGKAEGERQRAGSGKKRDFRAEIKSISDQSLSASAAQVEGKGIPMKYLQVRPAVDCAVADTTLQPLIGVRHCNCCASQRRWWVLCVCVCRSTPSGTSRAPTAA